MASENLGQVAGLFIGNNPPENHNLIWFDSTPSIQLHKVYNFDTSAWEVLNKNAIVDITYSELRNIAGGVGLDQGSWYKITDKANALALAITANKIQYSDVDNNILIDDLVSTVTYMVNSDNLYIDEVSGVWDTNTKRLVFSFVDSDSDMQNTDMIFGKKIRNGVISLVKYKLRSLISSVVGNSIRWNNGLFFDFISSIESIYDTSGGVVSFQQFELTINNIETTLNSIASTNQSILQAAKNYTDSKTTDSEIYSKRLPSAPTSGVPTDIAQNDTLANIITKIHRWINKFKYANGILLTPDFAETPIAQNITNADTVDSALRKIQHFIAHSNTELKLPEDWQPSDINSIIVDLAANDLFITAFSKLQGKLNQLGYISNGFLESRAIADGDAVTTFAINNGYIELHDYNVDVHSVETTSVARYNYERVYLHQTVEDQETFEGTVDIRPMYSVFKLGGSSYDNTSGYNASMLIEGDSVDYCTIIRNKYANKRGDLLAGMINNEILNTHLSIFNVTVFTSGTNEIVNNGLVILPYDFNTSTAASVVKLPTHPKNGTIIRIISLVPNHPNHITEIQVGNNNHYIFYNVSNQTRIYPYQYNLYTFVFHNNLWYAFVSPMWWTLN